MLSLFPLLLLDQEPAAAFATPPAVAESQRVALSPKLDGKIDAEEWDALASAGGMTSYFQWEPGKLHVAAKLPVGRSMVVSFDLKGNGWLVGKDNLELRVTWKGNQPDCKVRLLDATAVSGPQWIEASHFQEAVACAASAEGDGWIAEVTLTDPGLREFPERPGEKIGVRFDAVEGAFEPAAFLPRLVATVETALDRASNVPGGLRWKPQIVSRGVAPGAGIRIRMTFNGANELDLRRVEMRTEGLAATDTAKSERPFPSFDNKGRAFVDYNSAVAPTAMDGYRLMRTTITDGKGQATVIQTSYFIAPSVVLSFAGPGKLKLKDAEQKVRCSVYARSNGNKRINGVLRVEAPTGWTVASGDDKAFIIANPYGSVRRVFELSIPAAAKGTFPIKLQADVGGKSYAQVAWVTLG